MTTYFHIRVSTDLFVDSHIATGSTHAGGMSTTFNPKFKEFCIAHFNKYIMALENADADEKRTHIHIHGESVLHGNSQSTWSNCLKADKEKLCDFFDLIFLMEKKKWFILYLIENI